MTPGDKVTGGQFADDGRTQAEQITMINNNDTINGERRIAWKVMLSRRGREGELTG